MIHHLGNMLGNVEFVDVDKIHVKEEPGENEENEDITLPTVKSELDVRDQSPTEEEPGEKEENEDITLPTVKSELEDDLIVPETDNEFWWGGVKKEEWSETEPSYPEPEVNVEELPSDVCIEENMKVEMKIEDHAVTLREMDVPGDDSFPQFDTFSCDACGKIFNCRRNILRHLRFHTGENKCEVCGKVFGTNYELNIHERNHKGTKPFECELCGVKFNCRTDLNVHKRIHTGEKPYKCQLCGKHFTRSTHLYKHERNHAGENPFKCD
ncbi:uncharacterized protein [Periplaneta americana]|uniref:uncharacterized protein isoform X3 n=1 Tax=Periplaneta americana TaxID=6978 RepID=UPI0037E76C06